MGWIFPSHTMYKNMVLKTICHRVQVYNESLLSLFAKPCKKSFKKLLIISSSSFPETFTTRFLLRYFWRDSCPLVADSIFSTFLVCSSPSRWRSSVGRGVTWPGVLLASTSTDTELSWAETIKHTQPSVLALWGLFHKIYWYINSSFVKLTPAKLQSVCLSVQNGTFETIQFNVVTHLDHI